MKPTRTDERERNRKFEEAQRVCGDWMSDEESRRLPTPPDIYSDDVPLQGPRFDARGGRFQRRDRSRDRFGLSRKHQLLLAVGLVKLAVVAAVLYVNHIGAVTDAEPRYNRYSRRSRPEPEPRTRKAVAESDSDEDECPPVAEGQIYRFVSGIDRCLTQMSAAEISAELNDPWATAVLRRNAGGAGVWPDTVPEVVAAVKTASQSQGLNFQQNSYMIGEGSQVPASVTPRDSNRDLRYVVSWGQQGQSPVIFLSAAPAGLQPPGTPAPFLQFIAFDPQKKVFNYYQYVNNRQVTDSPASDDVRTWAWAGDSTHARQSQTVGRGCFACHLNGALNMKELTPPWNNWHSPQASISTVNIPAQVAQDPLFINLSGADRLQVVFQGSQFNFARQWVSRSVSGTDVSGVPELLRRLIVTTTVNFASSQTQSRASADVTALPKDFFLYDSVLNGVLNLNYTVPPLQLARADYDAFLRNQRFALVNTASNGPPDYLQPGSTFFAFYVPVPAFEDTRAIQQLIQQKVVSGQFAAAVLMVDFQNPVFSPARMSLMRYAEQIAAGKTVPDPADVPTQFAALVSQAAAGQPPCDTSQLSACTPEQQFLFYFQSDWQARSVAQINAYLQSVGGRIQQAQGVNDYLTLAASRRTQFANYPLVCNLHEFDLQLPCTSLGDVFVRMNADGTTGTQQSYRCPNSSGTSPCASQIYKSFLEQ